MSEPTASADTAAPGPDGPTPGPAASSDPGQTPEPTPAASSAEPTPDPCPSPTDTPSPAESSPTPSDSATADPSPTPTDTATPDPTDTGTPDPTPDLSLNAANVLDSGHSRKWTRATVHLIETRLDPRRYRSVTGGRPGRGDAIRPPCASLEPHVSTVRSARPTGPSRWARRTPVRCLVVGAVAVPATVSAAEALHAYRPDRQRRVGARRPGGLQRDAARVVARLHVHAGPGSNAPSTAVRDALLGQGYALVGLVVRPRWRRLGRPAGGPRRRSRPSASPSAGSAPAERDSGSYAWGASLGGLITQTLAERRPGLVDGVAPLCGVLAGTNKNLDLALDVAVAVKQFFYPKLRLRGYREPGERAGQRGRRHEGDPRPARRPATAQAAATGRMLGTRGADRVRREDEGLHRCRHSARRCRPPSRRCRRP